MNYFIETMKKIIQSTMSVVAVLALVMTTFTPMTVGATLEAFTNQPTFQYTGPVESYSTNGNGSISVESSSHTAIRCNITANYNEVVTGGSVTLTWDTEGADSLTINGESISGAEGSKTYTNITEGTTYVLRGTNDTGGSCTAEVRVGCLPPPVVTACELTVEKAVNKSNAAVGDELTYTINVVNTGTANCTGTGVLIADVVNSNLQYQSHALAGEVSGGHGSYAVYTAADRTLRFNAQTLVPDEEVTVTWVGKVVAPSQCGDFSVSNQAKATAQELSNFGDWAYSNTVNTSIDNDCHTDICDKANVSARLLSGDANSFTVEFTNDNDCSYSVGATSYRVPVEDGLLCNWQNHKLDCQVRYDYEDITLAAGETRAVTVSKPNKCFQLDWYYGISVAVLDYSQFGNPLLSYIIDADTNEERLYGAIINASVEECREPEPVPVCDSFTATPATVDQGSPVTLSWGTSNATAVYIDNGIGRVDQLYGFDSSLTYTPIDDTKFVMTVAGTDYQEVFCEVPVTVKKPEPEVFSCANNVSFTASDYSIDKGDDTKLSWNVTSADSVSINYIDKTSFSGIETVSPTSDITYTLTAKKGTEQISCPLSVDVSSDGGGGGGGSSSPRCELEISDKKIESGDTVTLSWNTSNATEIILTDDRGEVILTTDDYTSSEKKKYFDDSLKLKPTRDTEYTLIAEHGSKDDECTVKVEVDGDVVVLQSREQQPLVAGIALSQVPYTGFEAGPFMTFMFYLLLVLWALYLSYLFVIRNRMITPEGSIEALSPIVPEKASVINAAVERRPDLFVAKTIVATQPVNVIPSNLPTGTPVIGYENLLATEVLTPARHNNPHQVDETVVTDIENRAHQQKALLSSDAVRHFVATTDGEVERDTLLDTIIKDAKKTYPLEDGWVVINEQRMRMLCTECKKSELASDKAPFIPATVPEGTGSLAEAIVTGNIVAAYQMIGNRPMFALADASADLDALYRHRKGGKQPVSDLLISETKRLSDEQIKDAIAALTSAIDGTYTDEASAVKMAIMKAVKAVA